MKLRGLVTGISYLSEESLKTVAVILVGAVFTKSRLSWRPQLTIVKTDSSFEFQNVPPGQYEAIVMGGATPHPPRADDLIIDAGSFSYRATRGENVAVSDVDVDGIKLALPGVLFGRVVVDGGARLPSAPLPSQVFSFTRPQSAAAALTVELRGERPSWSSWVFPIERFAIGVSPRVDGLFSFDLYGSLFEKDAMLCVSELPRGYKVKSISYGATDLLRTPLKFEGAPTAEILITLERYSNPHLDDV